MSKRIYHRICFHSTPPLGTVLMLEGQRYELVTIKPYVRQDRTSSSILHWQSHCPDCGEKFITTTGLRQGNVNRRCPKHHKRGKPVSSKRKFYNAYRNRKMGGRYGR